MRARRLATSVAAASLLAGLGACSAADGAPAVGGDVGFVSGSGAVTITPAAERGEPIALAGPLVGGGDYDVASDRGKVVLINVWGSWCAPCRKEAPALQAAWESVQEGPGDAQFLGLNTRDDAAGAAEAFERRFGISYPSLRDPDGSLQLTFRTSLPPRAIPSTIILDRQGRVAARVVGASTSSTFLGLVETLLAEPA